jgi:aminoglycoside 6'-N-acetyltransferase I
VSIRALRDDDRAEWLRMRCALWPHAPREELEGELAEYLSGNPDRAVLVAARPEGGLCGFIELSLRPWAEGCRSGPVGYLEGWYVDPDGRRRGLGRGLVLAGEAWARSKGCTEMGSDAEVWNTVSHAAHGALGYREEVRIVCFAKRLD